MIILNLLKKKFNDEKNINNIPYIEENEDDKTFMIEQNKTLKKFYNEL